MYRRLDGARIVETLNLVQQRIEDRFPGSGLSQVGGEPRMLTDLMQSQAIQNFVFLGVAVVFLATVDTRLKRGRALKALHELRSIAHVVDMHQLGKAPNEFLPGREEIQVTPDRRMARADVARYLDYCTDLLSLTSKVAALYVEHLQDPVVLEAVNDVENLTAGLSRKIWQKIAILDTATR